VPVEWSACGVEQHPAPPDTIHGDLSILVVEDNEINRVVACGLLEKAGHHVCAVISGQRALTLLEHQEFDVILMDLNLPDLSGQETIRQIRSHQSPRVARTPVVVCSAMVTKHDIEDSLGAGANAFLGKPYSPQRLQAAIESALRSVTPVDHDTSVTLTPADRDTRFDPSADGALLTHHAAELGLATTQQIIGLFCNTMPATLAQARLAFVDGNNSLLLRSVHRMKSSASTIGLHALADLAATLEAAIAKEQHAQIHSLMAELEKRLPEAMASLAVLWADVQQKQADSS
jgi:two-component system sensor histidine kinase/response regulator